ncbi:MAG: AAA family ATPase [Balneolaceae bacterium]|nr:AAA family ATPase [Balneolaceae bacterium]
MIVLIGGEKGGTGKTTLATNLSALRAKLSGHNNVLLIDTDPQGSSADWTYYRREAGLNGVECIQLFGKHIVSEIDTKAERYDDIIIDAGGRDSQEIRYAMTIADVMIVPVGASQYDVNTIANIDDLLNQVQPMNPDLVCYAVVNNFPNHARLTEGADAIEFLKQFENVKPLDFIIHERISINRTSKGYGINESEDLFGQADPRAEDEILKLYKAIYE